MPVQVYWGDVSRYDRTPRAPIGSMIDYRRAGTVAGDDLAAGQLLMGACEVDLRCLCDTWVTPPCFVDLCFLWATEAAFASAAMTVTAGRARPRDVRSCLREKVTAGSTEDRGSGIRRELHGSHLIYL